jgi:hypothetical protein
MNTQLSGAPSPRRRLPPGGVVSEAWGWRRGVRTGTLPGGSGQQPEPRQAPDAAAQGRLMRAGGWQADPDALLQFLDAGGDLDQAQADRVELDGAPG